MALWLPTFSTDLVKRRLRLSGGASGERSRTAVLLTQTVSGRERVAQRCAVSAAAGVRIGMDLAQARAQVPASVQLHIEAFRPNHDAAGLERLACWALRISPTVAPCGDDLVLCDLTGTARLYGRELRVARSAARAVNRLGIAVRAAVAGTFGCAAAVARFGGERLAVVEPGREREVFASLPARALCDDVRMAEAFEELGIERVGEVLALPRRQVASRFGPALLHRIDQALGHAPEVIEPVHPPPPIEAEILFDGPTDRFESVEAAAHDAVLRLAALLTVRQRGVRRLDFAVLRPRREADRVVVELSRASASEKHLWKLLRSRLDGVDLGEPVDGVRATAARTARLRDRQGFDERIGGEAVGADASATAGELTDVLVNRLGTENVVRFAARESHLPERSFVCRSVMEPWAAKAGEVAPGERPTVLVDPPEPVSVMALTPDGPVLEIGWRGLRERVSACVGPERIGAEWWRWRGTADAPTQRRIGGISKSPSSALADSGAFSQRSWEKGLLRAAPPPDRDYFAVQLESGRWLWVCRQAGTSRWFVHGEWG